ncbi:MAG: type III pantothenate kinase [Idiomarina sp.]
MKLLIDAGNTRIKIANLDNEGRLEPVFTGSFEELTNWKPGADIDHAWLSSVSDDAKSSALIDYFASHQIKVTVVATEADAFGVTNAYAEHSTLGVDRWLGLIAAHMEQPKNTVIIDAGTAITVDWLAADGTHLGGWIIPGVELMVTAITSRSRRVFVNDTAYGRANHLGSSTPEGLQDGCVNAFVGIIKQALSVTETELDWSDYRLLLTGGSYPLLPADIKRRGEERPELVLQGLSYYARDPA